MGRFEREDNEAGHLPETLGIATEGLRSTVEVEVAKIVERAQARAAEIEERALERATRLEQESDSRIGAVFEDSRARMARLFAEMDSVETTLTDAVRSLRAETAQLSRDLNRARSEPLEVAESAPAPADDDSTEVGEVSAGQLATAEPAAAEANVPIPGPSPDPAVRELIRQQLVSFSEDGRTRADAERMLLRFKQGDQYFDLLDEIYPDEIPGRRGLLRRRKKRD